MGKISIENKKGKITITNKLSAPETLNERVCNAIASGVFFVSLEANGHVYAYVLNNDGSSVLLADFDPCLGGAMALDYDTDSKLLWIITDNNFNNKSSLRLSSGNFCIFTSKELTFC